jgi:hypothetical protein
MVIRKLLDGLSVLFFIVIVKFSWNPLEEKIIMFWEVRYGTYGYIIYGKKTPAPFMKKKRT